MKYAGSEQQKPLSPSADSLSLDFTKDKAAALPPTLIRYAKWPVWSYIALCVFGALLIYKANFAVGILALSIGLWLFFREAWKMSESDVYLRISSKGIRLKKANLISWAEIESIAVRKEQKKNRKAKYFLLLDGPKLYEKIPLSNLSHPPSQIEEIITNYHKIS